MQSFRMHTAPAWSLIQIIVLLCKGLLYIIRSFKLTPKA